MVEANPAESKAERLEFVEEQLFEQIDDEIRAVHNWLKDFVQEMTQRIESVTRRHLELVDRKLALLMQSKNDFK